MGQDNKALISKNYAKRMESWDFDESVKTMAQTVYKWKHLTVEIVEELYLARNILSSSGNPNENRISTGKNFPVNTYTWASYCQSIGITKRTANLWLERFIPEEQRLLESEELLARKKILKQQKEDYHKQLIQEYESTGVKPEDWDKFTDKLYQQHQVAQGEMIDPNRLPADYFQGLPTTGSPDPTNMGNEEVLAYYNCQQRNKEFLEPSVIERDQIWMFYRIEEYINTFPSRETQIRLIENMAKRLQEMHTQVTMGKLYPKGDS